MLGQAEDPNDLHGETASSEQRSLRFGIGSTSDAQEGGPPTEHQRVHTCSQNLKTPTTSFPGLLLVSVSRSSDGERNPVPASRLAMTTASHGLRLVFARPDGGV